jgi:hypothetical protein
VLPPRDSLRILEPGDIALGRLDVREELEAWRARLRASGGGATPGTQSTSTTSTPMPCSSCFASATHAA